ncbi:MAG: hypothetical protein F6K50_02770 [Moorea sp. SIO3I7]|uniref:hypothetical protein n=1 Tax=Moorena sp. SIO3I8 TaxID=2607833 RepID=UPI0013C0BC95|nr:hypothetical protein [Moorena sp. SIO3I8]NEN94485.1 hypothetical protein [Moorena sp. SIO3I7]NEO04931.1 hypothetical protein [Moorena sp. SIO3I8]
MRLVLPSEADVTVTQLPSAKPTLGRRPRYWRCERKYRTTVLKIIVSVGENGSQVKPAQGQINIESDNFEREGGSA